MSLFSKIINYWNKPASKDYYKEYVVLLQNFSFEDDCKYTNEIFRQLKNSGIAIVGSNPASDNWHFIVALNQKDELDHSQEVEDLMSLILRQFNLQIKKVWPHDNQ